MRTLIALSAVICLFLVPGAANAQYYGGAYPGYRVPFPTANNYAPGLTQGKRFYYNGRSGVVEQWNGKAKRNANRKPFSDLNLQRSPYAVTIGPNFNLGLAYVYDYGRTTYRKPERRPVTSYAPSQYFMNTRGYYPQSKVRKYKPYTHVLPEPWTRNIMWHAGNGLYVGQGRAVQRLTP